MPQQPRILVSDSDWRLLEFAYGDLRQRGYDVIVEASPQKALELARTWRPHVIIVAHGCLSEWDRHLSGGLEAVLSGAAVLATIDPQDEASSWQRWVERGWEVLLKPLIHASQLRAATDAALLSVNSMLATNRDDGEESNGPAAPAADEGPSV